MDEGKKFYSVGEVSRICKISKKALRFYDEIGIISPDKVMDNKYRYYSSQTLLLVPVVKYFKQMGFRLNEMKDFLEGSTYDVVAKAFRGKIQELEEEAHKLKMQETSVIDWYNLILEAEMVIENNITEVSVKYVEPKDFCFLEQDYNSNYMESIINIEFTNYIESLGNEITGPVMIHFPDYRKRLESTCEKMVIMQKTILECPLDTRMTLGGKPMITCYHIGSHESLGQTYEKMRRWGQKHGYTIGDGSYERYVTDYWTTLDKEKFVTELMLYVVK